MIKQDKIKIVDQQNKTVYSKEIKAGANQKEVYIDPESVEDEEEKDEEEDDVKLKFDKAAKNVSEDNSPVKTSTHLVIAEKDFKKLEVQVKD